MGISSRCPVPGCDRQTNGWRVSCIKLRCKEWGWGQLATCAGSGGWDRADAMGIEIKGKKLTSVREDGMKAVGSVGMIGYYSVAVYNWNPSSDNCRWRVQRNAIQNTNDVRRSTHHKHQFVSAHHLGSVGVDRWASLVQQLRGQSAAAAAASKSDSCR